MRNEMNPKTTNFHLQNWDEYIELYGCKKEHRLFGLIGLLGLAGWVAIILFRDAVVTDDPMKFFGINMCVASLLLLIAICYYGLNKEAIWKRNLVGYNLWIYRTHDSIPEHRDIVGQVLPKGQELEIRKCAIVIPLGGWRNNNPRIWYGDILKFHDIDGAWYLSNFSPVASHRPFTDSTVMVKTCHGEKMKLKINHALDYFNYRFDQFGREPTSPLPIYRPIGTILFQSACANIELRMANEECQNHAEALVNVIIEATQAISDTKRFGKSKEGARIREKLVSDTIALLPEDHSLRKKLTTSNRPVA